MPQQVASNTEKRVIKQLLEAIVFEKLLPFRVMEEDSKTHITIFGSNIRIYSEATHSSFGRIRLNECTINITDLHGHQTPEPIREIVSQLTSNQKMQDNLIEELQQTILLGDWNEENLEQPCRHELSYEELESAIMEGHPYHPCFKARTGFNTYDHEVYGPEARQSFQLWWVAVKRDYVRTSLPNSEEAFLQDEVGEKTYSLLLDRLNMAGGTIKSYSLFPVHPWQWKNKIQQEVKFLRPDDIIPLGYAGDFYRATQSVRTLWNETQPEKAHIKLPLNMVNTSSLRLIEPHSVCTAPTLSTWLVNLIESDSYLSESLAILPEYAGMVAMEEFPNISGHLAAIWRTSPTSSVMGLESAVPMNAMALLEKDGKPFILPWLERYGMKKWVEQFVKVTVVPIWHLLVSEGVALEAHAQNMILVHENGWPKRVILRDFHESLEYVYDFLKQPELAPNFTELHPCYEHAPNDEYYWMSSVEGLRELIMDTLFVFHLSELSFLLSHHMDFAEADFWKEVRDAIQTHFLHHPPLQERNKQLFADKEKIFTESLFTRKVGMDKREYRHPVNNSLFNEGKL
ncbi:siderophore biosynthesis protein [Sutcliffiella horikoshii]|uniref:Siderophore biosynthesis protein n=1 Tax=Sutcliffiella horikoshii TaxID=79883 RepID=A0A5D4T4Z0_9BACI|nr:IucA/IucC family protein [Sutcliffiella horikoshii]TYS70359.1 siderophore biosynthesis protein [Sutcliffiella horikoshii]